MLFGVAGAGTLLLGGTGAPSNHWIDILQVAGVRRKGDRHLSDATLAVGLTRTKVVLHVTGPAEVGILIIARRMELTQNGGVGFAQNMGQHIDPPTVGHADHHFTGTSNRSIANDRINNRYQHIGTLDREALLTREGLVEEAFEGLDLGQTIEEFALAIRIKQCKEAAALSSLTDPTPLLPILNLVRLIGNRA